MIYEIAADSNVSQLHKDTQRPCRLRGEIIIPRGSITYSKPKNDVRVSLKNGILL